MLKYSRLIIIFLILTASQSGWCQKQLVLLKGENVLLRLYPGDELIYKLKGGTDRVTTYVNNISDTAVVTHNDTVPFHRIDRLYFEQRKFYNTVGRALVIFGAGLFLIDQFNVVIVQGNSPTLDDRVSTISLSALAAGLPLMLIKKKSQRLRHGIRLMMVGESSPFYRPDIRDVISNDGN